MTIIENIAQSLSLKTSQIQIVLDMFEEGATIPFIARYRKEQTGNLDEDQLRSIEQTWKYQNALQDRKASILQILEEKKLLTHELKQAIDESQTLANLEEVYRPYKEKRKTKATEAIAKGFGPLADQIWEQKYDPAQLADTPSLEQAGYILAEKISDRADLRKMVREYIEKNESITSMKKKDAQDPQGIYQNYYEFSNTLTRLPSHRVLALDRAEKEKILTVSITSDVDTLQALLQKKLLKPSSPSRAYLEAVIRDALVRLMLPSIKREIRSELREKAHEHAIKGFAANLSHLLMARPLKGQVLLSWDPGYVNGCKLAMLSANGAVLDTTVVFPFRFMGKNDEVNQESRDYLEAVKVTKQWIRQYHPTIVVIGNGTASRESEDLIANLLEDYPDISYLIGSEAGASVYSASELAKEEFPDLPVEKRSAISIGRRVQDPLSELVKIDPQSLGIGEYQHDVPQKQLRETLDFATDKAVNQVGVNINTASPSLLRHVSGLKKPQINKIVKARDTHPFTNRLQLEKLLSAQTYQQSIGFLRILNGENPLDNTGIHPESYELTNRLLQEVHLSLSDLHTQSFKDALAKLDAKALAKTLESDLYTITDIIQELHSPGLDPRDKMDAPILKKGILKIEDLTEGMELQGTIRNVTSFGAFVDIGLHEDGLVHISRLCNHFVSDPNEVVHTGQIVTVYVVDTDVARKRISLTMIDPSAPVPERKPHNRKGKHPQKNNRINRRDR
ncbi:Tex-like N-terminal domain-containing protein [Allobaculum stercoricanis]|uniref:Tex-like N-terminal domain-containing protein n=1 Tax=Allobaculum stercoricanis TaxID=174709 RepID=UPI00036FDE19|nr:Tex family protein [Allobaculum stercoricanis]